MSQTTIYKTKDYAKFGLFKYNRKINEGLVKRLMASIQKIGYIHGKSVITDAELNIIDGQHRFEACKRLNLPIYYMISKADPQETMIELNAQQVGWKMADYINSWAAAGVKCYQQLKDFEAVHHLGTTNAVLIVFDNGLEPADIKNIKAGKVFKINPKMDEIVAFIQDCKIAPYYKSSYFIKAVVRVFKMATPKQLEKIKNSIISLPQQATAAAYVTAFENIANRGVQSKNRVSFKANS
jgi:hypothetical protein